MNSNERKRGKSKSPASIKKSQQRIEALKVSIEKKKKCNVKALEIVTQLSEDTVTEHMLLDNLKFINQEHYQDIVEERAINKFCGYPLCSKQLKNIPSKQYHISTTLNKVFDITDRKNFCCNICYKASKFLKEQVSTSPLWLRDDEHITFKLISLQSRGGMSGDEVDLGVSPVKIEVEVSVNNELPELNEESYLETFDNDLKFEKSKNLAEESKNIDEQCNVTVETASSCSTKPLDFRLASLENCSEESESQNLIKVPLTTPKIQSHDGVMYESLSKPDCKKGTEDCVSLPNDKNVVQQKSTSINSTINEEINRPDCSISGRSDSQSKIIASHKYSSKRKASSDKNKNHASLNPIQNVVLKIEQILREWISIDSLCFIYGEDKIKEILAEKNDKNLPLFTQDVHFYERYVAICKKLNILELEDTKIDSSCRDEAKKPLPDYEALKEEAKQMEIKVKMFYKGDKVQFMNSELSPEIENKSKEVDMEPVLPLVDLHAQKALRRRIVIDKLKKVIQDLQKSLGLRGMNLTEGVRILVGTLTLSAHNITMKPAEWNLVAIAIIKLLSLRDSQLAQSLTSSTASRHMTLLLMSYSLDSAYLDRLMIWLMDVEAVLQKS